MQGRKQLRNSRRIKSRQLLCLITGCNLPAILIWSPKEELLGLLPHKGQTREEDIVNTVIECMDKHIPLDKIVLISTDGAKSMTGASGNRYCVTVSEAKREEFVDDLLIYAKSLCEELEISFEPPRRIRRKHIFGDGSKDVQLSYENDLRRTMVSSVHSAAAEIRERFQQLQSQA
ncbi:uncharacterized protein TNCV_2116151 [Trichonephila clavipes]|nr:uncharacterized protein TNCV_2116151 [Trichonephila clavipes]